MFTTEQVAQCRVNNNTNSSVTVQRLVVVKTRATDASYWTQLIQYFGCFSVVVATITDERELQCKCRVGSKMVVSVERQMQHQSCTVVGGQYGHTSTVWQEVIQRQSVVAGCATLKRTQSSLWGSASFCSIRCVLAAKFSGKAIRHEISKTQNSFLEIPHRDDLIRLLTNFFNVF